MNYTWNPVYNYVMKVKSRFIEATGDSSIENVLKTDDKNIILNPYQAVVYLTKE